MASLMQTMMSPTGARRGSSNPAEPGHGQPEKDPYESFEDHIDQALDRVLARMGVEKLQKQLAELEQLAQAGALGQEMWQLRQEKQEELQQAQSELEELERPMREFFGL